MSQRKARQVKDTKRRGQASQSARQTVLIVCEGTKTELNYFKDLRQHYNLQAVHTVDVTSGSSGRNARNILLDAKKRYKISKDKGDPYDHVYCVFDRDDEYGANAGFREVIAEIKKTKNFYAAYSIPSFEFWLLLHFTYTRQCFESSQQVFEKLQKHYKTYQKNQIGLFRELEIHLEQAFMHADRCLKEAKDSDNPSTTVHELVRRLQKLCDERKSL